MMFMSMEFMKEIPFRYVFIHGLVRDSQGRKMSKSLGNGIDPLEVIENMALMRFGSRLSQAIRRAMICVSTMNV